MKKRILSAVALLCMVVCLSGCSNIEWVTESYEDITFQVPVVWEKSEGMEYFSFNSDDIPKDFQGSLFVDTFSTTIYESEIDYIEKYVLNSSDDTILEQEQLSIAGVRGYYCKVQSEVENDAITVFYYVFQYQDEIYSFGFINCGKDVQEQVIDSIQINE